jgi:hypothetical protein
VKGSAAIFVVVSFVSFQAVSLPDIRNARAQQASEIKRTPLFQQDPTLAGYQAIMNIVVIPPGISQMKHTHPGPLSI